MPRRLVGETGYYHVTTRTAGQIAMFEDDEDRRAYLRAMRDARDESGVRIIAWVLMTDHVHLVVDCGESAEALSDFMYVLNKKYVKYFNEKTGRSGHLFQGNFWSKPIQDDSQLLATVYYVHRNPEAAGIAPLREYRWSSYKEYAGKHWVVDTSLVLGMLGSFDAFDKYVARPEEAARQNAYSSLTDEEVVAIALEIAKCSSSSSLRQLPQGERNTVIFKLYDHGATIRQIARALGIGAATVSRRISNRQ